MKRTAADKFREELRARIRWWATEFDLDHWSIIGVLFDAMVDSLYGVDIDDDDDSEDDEEIEDDDNDGKDGFGN